MKDSGQLVYYAGDPLGKGAGQARELLGGKGAGLYAMAKADLPVPPFFVISTECCRYFLSRHQTWPKDLEAQIREQLARLEQDASGRYGCGVRPLLLAVRSGAVVSMPGMMDTLLNCGLHPDLAEDMADAQGFWKLYVRFIMSFSKTVAGLTPEQLLGPGELGQPASRTTADELLAKYHQLTGLEFPTDPWQMLCQGINAVMRSWNNQRAVAYRRRNGLDGLIGTAVTVQAMFPSQVAGVLFTQDPTDPAAERMVIEAAHGLGQAVVSGEITPERFTVSREDSSQVRSEADAICLTAEQITELCKLGLKVEKLFDKPMDIEWGLGDGQFALFQCRPIGGLDLARDVEVGREEEIRRLGALAGNKPKLWFVHNLGQTLSHPTPLTWDIVSQFMSGKGGFGRMYKDFGYRPAKVVEDEGFLELICGRIYVDPDRLARLFFADIPLVYDPQAILQDPKRLDRAPEKFEPAKIQPNFLIKLPGILFSMIRCWRTMKKAAKYARDRFENQVLPAYLNYVSQKRLQDLTCLSTADLLSELSARCRRVLDEFGCESLKPGFFGGLALEKLTCLLVQLAGTQKGQALAGTLTMALEGNTTFEQNLLLADVAHGNSTMEQFLDRFGHRAAGEMELSQARWREEPSYIQRLTSQLCSGPNGLAPRHEDNVGKRHKAQEELADTLAQWGASAFLEQVNSHLAIAQTLLPYRENGKYYLMMGYELIRQAILELARRWNLGNDVFYLKREEIERFESERDEFCEKIAKRKLRWKSAQQLPMGAIVDSRQLESLGLAQQFESTEVLQGQAIAGGVASGPARIVLDPHQAQDLGTGYILVCPSTDPGWTTLFLNARGLIVECGGMLSHGAIVARDFGIPAVVCPAATSRLQEGVVIQVDGNRGKIFVAEENQGA